MSKKRTRGGARAGAGRKPLTDPKAPVTIYVEESIIKAMGGLESLREECYSFLRKKVSKS